MRSLSVGEPVVLEPEGLVGRVAEIRGEGEDSRFMFETDTHSEVLGLASIGHRWRFPISSSEAAEIERQILHALPIDGLEWHETLKDSDTTEKEWSTLQAYLEGNREQRVTGYATLLDWHLRAASQNLAHGPWRGRLMDAREYLLGEILLARGISMTALVDELSSLRACVSPDALKRVGEAALLPKAAHTLVSQNVFHEGSSTIDLGSYSCSLGVGAALGSGWHVPCRSIDLTALLEDRIPLNLAKGMWRARLFVQPSDVPATFSEAGVDRSIEFELIYRRTWLVLHHVDHEVGVPVPVGGQLRTAKELQLILDANEDSDRDLIESVPFAVRADRDEALEVVGRIEPWEHRIAVAFGDHLGADMAAGIRRHLGYAACVWDWGLVFHTSRFAKVPVFVAGPEHARRVIAIAGGGE